MSGHGESTLFFWFSSKKVAPIGSPRKPVREERSVVRQAARCRGWMLERREGAALPLRADWRPSSCRVTVIHAVEASTTERKRRHVHKPLDFQWLRRYLRCWPRTAGASDELRRWKQTRATMVPSGSHGLWDAANRLAYRGHCRGRTCPPSRARRWRIPPSGTSARMLIPLSAALMLQIKAFELPRGPFVGN